MKKSYKPIAKEAKIQRDKKDQEKQKQMDKKNL